MATRCGMHGLCTGVCHKNWDVLLLKAWPHVKNLGWNGAATRCGLCGLHTGVGLQNGDVFLLWVNWATPCRPIGLHLVDQHLNE